MIDFSHKKIKLGRRNTQIGVDIENLLIYFAEEQGHLFGVPAHHFGDTWKKKHRKQARQMLNLESLAFWKKVIDFVMQDDYLSERSGSFPDLLDNVRGFFLERGKRRFMDLKLELYKESHVRLGIHHSVSLVPDRKLDSYFDGCGDGTKVLAPCLTQ